MYLSFIETVASVNDQLNALVWGLPMLLLLVGTGLYLSARAGFLQFRHFGYAMKNTLGRVLQRQEAGAGELTPFQAVSTALAATVGTGNIVGVTGAIILGGPGAVFWMWVSALLGMATKYAEVLLSVRYRRRNAKGEWVGGPMYYMENGLGRRFKWLSVLFCLFGVMASFGIGNIAQINSIAGSVNTVAAAFFPAAAQHQTAIAVTVGFVIAGFTALVLLGGLKRIGGLGHPGDDVRVAPVAVQRRREETIRGFRGVDAARNERGRDEVRHVQLALQGCDRLGLCRLDVESGRHGGYLLIAVLSYSSPLLSHKCMAAPPGSAAVGGQRGKLFGRRALMRYGSARGSAATRCRPGRRVPAAPAAASAAAPFAAFLQPFALSPQPGASVR